MSAVIERSVQARLLADPVRALRATLRFDAGDPLAVRLVFPPEAALDHTEATWTFGRELLDAGLRTPSGEGDVHIRPSLTDLSCTIVELHTPEGVAVLELPVREVREFLRRSYTCHPAHRVPDLDAELAALLRGVHPGSAGGAGGAHPA